MNTIHTTIVFHDKNSIVQTILKLKEPTKLNG